MKQSIIQLSLITLLSALLYSGAFIYQSCSIIIIPAIMLLYYSLVQASFHTFYTRLLLGFLWSMHSFGLHSSWIPILLYTQKNCSLVATIIFSTLLISYFIVFGIILFLVQIQTSLSYGIRLLYAVATTKLVFCFIYRFGLIIFGIQAGGYPFFSPSLPLISYIQQKKNPYTHQWKHLPVAYTAHNKRLAQTPYMIINHYADIITNNPTINFFIAGESAIPYAINDIKKYIPIIQNVLKPHQKIIIGCIDTKNEHHYQSLCVINHLGIEDIYHKQHVVPFFEATPHLLQSCTHIQKALKRTTHFTADSSNTICFWHLSPTCTIIPSLCSDFFLKNVYTTYAAHNNHTYILLAVNDGWFVAYFKKIMENQAQQEALIKKIPILYVGHFSIQLFLSEDVLCKSIYLKMLKMLAWLVK